MLRTLGLALGAFGAGCAGQRMSRPSTLSPDAALDNHTVRCAAPTPSATASPLSPAEFRSFPLINVYDESADTKVFRFALPEGDQELGMTLSSCIVLRFVNKDGKEITRPYTPISRLHQRGYFELLVKNYKGSQMGSHLHKMRVGDTIEVKGPYVKFDYKPNMFKHIGMIAGGTGITPMFQILREILKDKKEKAEVNLIYACRRKEDVLLGNELNELMELNPAFAPYYVLSQPPQNWMGGVGHVTKDMIKAFMPPPTRPHDSIILVCGPPAMMNTICGDKDFSTYPPQQGELKGMLKEMGYIQKHIFKF
jgi:cytochrome-b5 reductase